MKLYATTTSERASKGQGGNDYLDVKILDENENIISRLLVYPPKNSEIDGMVIFTPPTMKTERYRFQTKGKKKTSERCGNCGGNCPVGDCADIPS